MGGPTGEFPAPWFANRGLVALSVPCNRGVGSWSLPSPPVRGQIKCTVCTVCALVKARLPSLWRLGTGKEDRGPRCGWKKRLKTLTYGFFVGQFPSSFGIVEGTPVQIIWKSPESWFTCGRLAMEMQRCPTRWKTKRWIMDSTVTAFITLTLVLHASNAKAGKKWPNWMSEMTRSERQPPPGSSVTDDGDWTWTFLYNQRSSVFQHRSVHAWRSLLKHVLVKRIFYVIDRFVKFTKLNPTLIQNTIGSIVHVFCWPNINIHEWMKDKTPLLMKFILCCFWYVLIDKERQLSGIHLRWKTKMCM